MERIRADILHDLIADQWPSVRAFWSERLRGTMGYSTLHEIYTGVTGNPRRIGDLAAALDVSVDVLYGRQPTPTLADRYYTLDNAPEATAPYKLRVSSALVRQLGVPLFSVVTDVYLSVLPWAEETISDCWLCLWRPTGRTTAVIADVVDTGLDLLIVPAGVGDGHLLSHLLEAGSEAPGEILGAIGPDLSMPCLQR